MALIKGGPVSLSGSNLHLGDLQRQADDLIENTRARVADMVRAGQDEARRLMKVATETAREEGYTAGFEQGRAEGQQQGRQDALKQHTDALDSMTSAWMDALETWNERRREMLHDADADLLSLAVALAERIVRRQIVCDPDVIVDQLSQVIRDMANPSKLDVRIHPDDRSLLEDAMPRVLASMVDAPQVSLRDDERIERGGCLVQAGRGIVDATIATQLDRIAEALLPDVNRDGSSSHNGDDA